MMKTSRQINRRAKRLYHMCLHDGILDETRAKQVVHGVLSAKLRDGVALLGIFCRFVKRDRAQHTAEVGSAIPLNDDLQAHLRSGLEHVYGPGITTVFVQQPELIGGMRVKIGSDLYDGTVKGKLDAFEARL